MQQAPVANFENKHNKGMHILKNTPSVNSYLACWGSKLESIPPFSLSVGAEQVEVSVFLASARQSEKAASKKSN